MRAYEFIRERKVNEQQQLDEFLPAIGAAAGVIGRGALAGAQMLGRGAMAAGRLAANAAQKGAQAVGQVAKTVGNTAGQVGRAAVQGAERIGQGAQQAGQTIRQANTMANRLDLAKDITSQLSGKDQEEDPNNQQQAQTDPTQLKPTDPNATVGTMNQEQEQQTNQPQQDSPEIIGRNRALAKLAPAAGQALASAVPKTGSTIQNPKTGPLKVLPPEPGVPDQQKGLKLQATQIPGMPPITLKYKDLAQNPKIKKDLGIA